MPDTRRLPGRLIGEFLVIVVGVLVALAADRWNEDRSRADLEATFLARLAEEIRADSSVAAEYLENLPGVMAARDSLISFVEGSAQPPDLRSTVIRAFPQLDLPTPLAWSEMQATVSLNVVQDPVVREALTRYYSVDRERVEINLQRADRRGRDPFMDALYRVGWIQPTGNATEVRPFDADAFQDWPGMRALLVGLGSAHGVQATFGRQLIQFSNNALVQLPVNR